MNPILTWSAPILIVIAAVLLFNRLVRLNNRVRTAWSDIDVQLTRRHDLIPQLVRVVRAYADHEAALLTTVTELRNRARASSRPPELAGLEKELEKAVSRLFALKEDYPELKADGNFAQLQTDLVETENKLQYARRYYNGAVRDYNTRIGQFPDLLIARAFGFSAAEFYRADDTHRRPVDVSLEPGQ